jgi:hypothetical protein
MPALPIIRPACDLHVRILDVIAYIHNSISHA